MLNWNSIANSTRKVVCFNMMGRSRTLTTPKIIKLSVSTFSKQIKSTVSKIESKKRDPNRLNQGDPSNKDHNKSDDISSDKTNLNFLGKMSKDQLQAYHWELKNALSNFQSPPEGIKTYIFFHLLPSVFLIPNFFNYLPLYQIFWAGAVSGMVYVNYEYYSNNTELNIMNRHLIKV